MAGRADHNPSLKSLADFGVWFVKSLREKQRGGGKLRGGENIP